MSDLTSTPTAVDPGAQRHPAAPSTDPQSPAPRSSRPPIKAAGGRPVKYPIQMKLNINRQWLSHCSVCVCAGEYWGEDCTDPIPCSARSAISRRVIAMPKPGAIMIAIA